MKRVLFVIFALVSVSATAQIFVSADTEAQPLTNARATAIVQSNPKTERLTPFTKVVVDGSVNITFRQVDNIDEMKIVYDTKGNTISRFRAGVDKNGVLQIVERTETKTVNIATEVTVCYTALDNISIAHATALFENTIESRLLDLSVTGGANVTIDINTLDALVTCSGKSQLTIGGTSKYFKLTASSAKIEGFELKTTAADIDASHESEVNLSVAERLEAVTSTEAKLFYKGRPLILRNKNSLFGGAILSVEE